MNPYYYPEKLELEMLSFDEPDLSYEYNTLCFWATKDGQIYSASDSGCSCPTPFEDGHDCQTRDEVLQTLERVGSVTQAESIFDSRNKGYLLASEKQKLAEWVNARLKA
jgi:hypothetical protein